LRGAWSGAGNPSSELPESALSLLLRSFISENLAPYSARGSPDLT
jgi:hypothetical protein